MWGSPPRVRGKPPRRRLQRPRPRLTPACAGKTRPRWTRQSHRRAHPRVCGENGTPGMAVHVVEGSPPRVRGKLVGYGPHSFDGRLTPACAGKTRMDRHHPPPRRAHPRVCGENRRAGAASQDGNGSPPRVRGKHRLLRRRDRPLRLTPACAGKTVMASMTHAVPGAHPRVCGENEPVRALVLDCDGSPPRVRGKREARDIPRRRFRLTPACAGKTLDGRRGVAHWGAHPRVCGENLECRTSQAARHGSPPRVRGKHDLHRAEDRIEGLTPACAGKTL